MTVPAYPLTARQTNGTFGAILLAIALSLGAVSAASPNAVLAWISIAVLGFGAMLLWRPGEPPILLYVFGFQWIQASTAIFTANWRSIPLDDLYPSAGAYSDATLLSLAAIAALALGMRIAAGSPRPMDRWKILDDLQSRPLSKWFQLYLAFAVLGALAQAGANAIPALSQVLGGIAALHWAFFLLLAGAHFAHAGRGSLWFYAAFVFELALGLGGYFSSFKTVFMVTALALCTASAKPSLRTILFGLVVAGGVLYLGVIWTAIKPDYRAYVNGGANQQIVTIEYGERMQKLGELVTEVDAARFWAAGDDMLARLSYVEFFGATLIYVPKVVPHENGALLIDAVARPFMPRLFFPEKTAIDDSVRTRKYTGRMVSGAETGTSISLGWIAELYIDFGRWLMMPFAVLVGWFYGEIHRFLINGKWSEGALGAAVSSSILISAAFLESSITKVTGGLAASFLAAWIVIRFLLPIVAPSLSGRRRLSPPGPHAGHGLTSK